MPDLAFRTLLYRYFFWLACGLLLYALGNLVEVALDAPGLSALFYVPGALSVPVNAVIGAVWVALKALPGPF